jgi:predicted hydrocarbon binding protein
MNIFERFMLSREVLIKEGEITMDSQRVVILPVNFLGNYTLKYNNENDAKGIYEIMKRGMIDYSVPIGKKYALAYRDYLDRWVKYCAFGGWGIVTYRVVETEGKIPNGVVEIKELPLHKYLKNKGISEASSDPLFDGLIAGSLSTTFNKNIDILEVKCICAGDSSCVYYWGSKEHLTSTFPKIASKRFGT